MENTNTSNLICQAAFRNRKAVKDLCWILFMPIIFYMSFICFTFGGIPDCFEYLTIVLVLSPLPIIPAVIAVVTTHLVTARKQLNVYANGVSGKALSGAVFSLTPDQIWKVTAQGYHGIQIFDKLGSSYKFASLDNRDELCAAMSNLGIAVQPELIKDKDTVIDGDVNKTSLFILRFSALASAFLCLIFAWVTDLWYNSDSNMYYVEPSYDYSYYYGYYSTGGYWRHEYYPEEMFTLYLAILFALAAITLMILHIVFSGRQLSVSPNAVRGVGKYGKITVFPTNQITFIKASSNSVKVRMFGKSRKYPFIKNSREIAQLVNSYRASIAPAQPVYQQPVQPMYQQPYAQPAYIPEQPYFATQAAAQPAAPTIFQVVSEPNQPDTPTSSAPTDSADEILKLKKLLDDEIITQEEFDAKKKQLLGL